MFVSFVTKSQTAAQHQTGMGNIQPTCGGKKKKTSKIASSSIYKPNTHPMTHSDMLRSGFSQQGGTVRLRESKPRQHFKEKPFYLNKRYKTSVKTVKKEYREQGCHSNKYTSVFFKKILQSSRH